MSWKPEVEELRRREAPAAQMGGAERVARQHEAGRLTVRERIARIARIDGRRVVVGGDDFTVRGGAADAAVGYEAGYSERTAPGLRLPIVRLVEGTGGGGSVKSLETRRRTYVPANPAMEIMTELLSTVPAVAAALGPVAGLGAARAVFSHFSVTVKGSSQLFVAGPPIVRRGIGQDVDKETLGGSAIHTRQSGAVDNEVGSEDEAFAQVRRSLSHLPASVHELPPVEKCDDPPDRREEALLQIVPRSRREPHDLRRNPGAGSRPRELLRGCAALRTLARHGPCAPGRAAGPRDGQRPALARRSNRRCGLGQDGPLRRPVRPVPPAGGELRRQPGIPDRRRGRDWASLPIEGAVEAAYKRDLEAAADPDALRRELEEKLSATRSPLRTAEIFGVEEIIDPRDTRPLLCDWVETAYRPPPEEIGRKARGMRP